MRIDDFSDVQDLMKTRAALRSSLAEIDDKLRMLGVVVPKPVSEFDHALDVLKAHRVIDDGLYADFDAGVPVTAVRLPEEHGALGIAPHPLLGENYGFALREGATRGTAQIVLRGDGAQKGILHLSRHVVLKWSAVLADYAVRGV